MVFVEGFGCGDGDFVVLFGDFAVLVLRAVLTGEANCFEVGGEVFEVESDFAAGGGGFDWPFRAVDVPINFLEIILVEDGVFEEVAISERGFVLDFAEIAGGHLEDEVAVVVEGVGGPSAFGGDEFEAGVVAADVVVRDLAFEAAVGFVSEVGVDGFGDIDVAV